MPHKRDTGSGPRNRGRPGREAVCEQCGKTMLASEEHISRGMSLCPACYHDPNRIRRGPPKPKTEKPLYGGYSHHPTKEERRKGDG